MARTNVRTSTPKIRQTNAPRVFTREGAPAYSGLSPIEQLRRSVLSCLLFEDEFYESGEKIADRIQRLANECSLDEVAGCAIHARQKAGLRHVPLLLAVVLAGRARGHERPQGVSDVVSSVIERVDELTELLAIYWKLNPGKNVPRQVRLGLQRAIRKFDRYQWGKYSFDKGQTVKLRDVLRIARPRPRDEGESALYAAIKNGTVETADTWETALMTGADKKETFTRLISEGRIGYLALLRNLRNMQQAGVDDAVIRQAILARKGARYVWPFRYIAAARAVPQYERELDTAMIASLGDLPQFSGTTAIMVDVSVSMNDRLSKKSDLTRRDAAATLAAIFPGNVRLFSFSNSLVEVPPRKGMAGVEAIVKSQPFGGTLLFDAVEKVNQTIPHDRIIVITDEQATGTYRHGHIQGHIRTMLNPACEYAYVINVASEKNGVGYGPWTHIDGFSESVLRFISELETSEWV